MNYDFAIAEHEEHGFRGLQALFMPGAEPASGLTAAHDIMEHFRGVDLDSDGEAMALGAMIYTRGKAGYWQRNQTPYNSPGRVMAGDVARLWQERGQWGDITDPGRTTRIDDEEVEYWIEQAIVHARKEIRDDFCGGFDEDWSAHNPPSQWGNWVRGWLRKGYRRAMKRYTLSSFTLADTFRRMEASLDEALKHADEGAIVRVSFVLKTCETHVYTLNYWEPGHPDYDPDQWKDDDGW